jgi:hypothetical protein
MLKVPPTAPKKKRRKRKPGPMLAILEEIEALMILVRIKFVGIGEGSVRTD